MSKVATFPERMSLVYYPITERWGVHHKGTQVCETDSKDTALAIITRLVHAKQARREASYG